PNQLTVSCRPGRIGPPVRSPAAAPPAVGHAKWPLKPPSVASTASRATKLKWKRAALETVACRADGPSGRTGPAAASPAAADLKNASAPASARMPAGRCCPVPLVGARWQLPATTSPALQGVSSAI
uniref:Ig-like domain-containing protein n=1 Tax=Macrostomum lignano TaxID=282301 RepID=A0A1I8HEL6_9PLAT